MNLTEFTALNLTFDEKRNITWQVEEMPVEVQVTWAVAFSVMLTAAILGNSIVIWSVTAHKRMRTVTNYFLINLSMADLTMSIFNGIFNFVYMLNKSV
ncbi:tachykinin-like peptides receptor 86C [Halyomorpha halys]|uniref:tachykinin-like peptides receptor 86C n=1 Tax=Halyomorpha halys TaxID=286706 RepID=UPI0034D28B30